MKLVGMIGTAVLGLTLGAAASAYAQQEQHEQQEEQKDKPAQDKDKEKKAQPEKPAKQQEEKKAEPENSAKPEERNARQEQPRAPEAKPEKQAQHASGGRIPDDRYKAHFGREHSFRVSQADYRNHRFQYGGYWFGFVDPWPSNWLYTQDVYVVDIGGVYYLCNPSYPGVNVAISVTL